MKGPSWGRENSGTARTKPAARRLVEDQGGQAELARPRMGEQVCSGKAFCLAFPTVWMGQTKTHQTK